MPLQAWLALASVNDLCFRAISVQVAAAHNLLAASAIGSDASARGPWSGAVVLYHRSADDASWVQTQQVTPVSVCHTQPLSSVGCSLTSAMNDECCLRSSSNMDSQHVKRDEQREPPPKRLWGSRET